MSFQNPKFTSEVLEKKIILKKLDFFQEALEKYFKIFQCTEIFFENLKIFRRSPILKKN